MADYANIQLHRENGVMTITIDRPEKRNALNIETIQEIRKGVEEALYEEEITGILLTGSGDKAFVAGADIAEFKDFSPRKGGRMSLKGHDAFNIIESAHKPVIAAVNGYALGGGLELAMACHLRIASDNAQFGQPEVKLGLIPGYGGTQRLPRLVGRGKATEMLLTGNPIKAEEALRFGLVNQVVSSEELIPTATALLHQMGRHSPLVIRKMLNLISDAYDKSVDGFANEIDGFGESFATDDFKEGTTAFLEKRAPRFTGR